ncbi:MAG: response regulator transcription factor [Dechloromonas sp.]|nr:MAG: response regulator transcription factor [Dechloromonas sp.]
MIPTSALSSRHWQLVPPAAAIAMPPRQSCARWRWSSATAACGSVNPCSPNSLAPPRDVWFSLARCGRTVAGQYRYLRARPRSPAWWRKAANKEIATRLEITERTVKAHLSAIFEKLGVRDRLQLSLRVNGVKSESKREILHACRPGLYLRPIGGGDRLA